MRDGQTPLVIGVLGALVVLGGMLGACGKPSTIAELEKADGRVERQQGGTPAWVIAPVATKYAIGDAAHTAADGLANLKVVGNAHIVMQRDTVLRFSGTPERAKISVESGAIELSGAGSYDLDIGNVELRKGGKVKIISKGNGQSSVELVVGEAGVSSRSLTLELALGVPIDLRSDVEPVIDAGVRAAPAPVDAGVDPVVDAAVDAVAGDAGAATIEVTGKRAELLAPGATAWKPIPASAGPGVLAPGSEVRLGAATTARLVAQGTTLELAGSTRVKLGEDLTFTIVQGVVSAATTAPATVALSGGGLALAGAPATPVQARLEANARDTKVTLVRGRGKLSGAGGAELGLNRGESAWLARAGTIRSIDAIPAYFDLRVEAGESLTIHDPRPPTAVQFQFDGKCPDGGIIEVDRDGRFRTAKVSSGREFANIMVGVGDLSYRLRCSVNGVDGGPVASGRIVARRDDGRRPLTKGQGVNDIDADGRNYRISYQSSIPSVVVHVGTSGNTLKLHLAAAGKEQTFDSTTQTVTVPGTQLHEGTYSYWVDRDGVKQDKVSSLTIDFDQTAPQVYIESPLNGQPWGSDIDVRGAVLPGWSAAVEAIAIPVDGQRRFSAKVGIPSGNALSIRLSHPTRGVHYYLRRQK